MQTARAWLYHADMSAEQYWTGWALALIFPLGYLLTVFGMAEILSWLKERKRKR